MGILVGIDGTGSAKVPGKSRDIQYDKDFAHSFVRTICSAGGPNALYQRGPVALGGGLVAAIDAGQAHIKSKIAAGVKEPVLLTGYSRGAAGVVSLASRLAREGIAVDALLMFDCVDRHLFIDAETIPENVANVFHVIRDPDSSSRESFGNDGLRYHPSKTKYQGPYTFMCTHGGMGGCPWECPPGTPKTALIDEGFGAGWNDGMTTISYQQDAFVSHRVWQYVQPFIKTHGFM